MRLWWEAKPLDEDRPTGSIPPSPSVSFSMIERAAAKRYRHSSQHACYRGWPVNVCARARTCAMGVMLYVCDIAPNTKPAHSNWGEKQLRHKYVLKAGNSNVTTPKYNDAEYFPGQRVFGEHKMMLMTCRCLLGPLHWLTGGTGQLMLLRIWELMETFK